MLQFRDGRPFATGVMAYEFQPATPGELSPRILIRLRVEQIPFLAAIDTGSSYLILSPQVASRLSYDREQALERIKIFIRGRWVWGELFRASLEFPAIQGESCSVEVTVFAPNEDEENWGELPSFVGMQNCLEHVRFAVDPAVPGDDAERGNFYFGPRDSEL